MAYLNVIPQPSPFPAVRGLGQALIPPRRIPLPVPGRNLTPGVPRRVRRGRGFGGLGQIESAANYLSSIFHSFTPASEVSLLINTPTPSLSALETSGVAEFPGGLFATSPDEAANDVYALADNYCTNIAGPTAAMQGVSAPADCGDGGQAAAAAAYPQWLAYYDSLPADFWSQIAQVNAGGGIAAPNPAYGQPYTGPAAPAPQPAISTLNQSGPVPATPTQASIQNLSNPGQGFKAGDQFQVTVTGAPNSPVKGTLNGSTSSFGNTNSSGSLTILGTFAASDVGSFQESWQVGSGAPASLSFSVAAVPQTTGNGGGSSSTSSSYTGGSSTGGGTTPAAPTGFDFSFLTQDITLGSLQIPVWGLGLGAVLLFMFLPKGRG